jgi:hypothetical protein
MLGQDNKNYSKRDFIPLWVLISRKIDDLLVDIITGKVEASLEVVDRLMGVKKAIQDDYDERIKK